MYDLDCEKWIRYFERNKVSRPVPRWDALTSVDERVRPLLEQSLKEFQLGDGGGPGALIAWNLESYKRRQEKLGDVLDLWFKEEHEHSRLLGGLLQRYGVAPIENHWSFWLFCFLRRWLGISFELQILTLTELSSTAYYRLLRMYSKDPASIDVFSLILRDESGHLAFQCDRLACEGAPGHGIMRLFWCVQFWCCGMVAASVLYASHGKCLRVMGVSCSEFYGEAHQQFSRFLVRLKNRACRKKREFELLQNNRSPGSAWVGHMPAPTDGLR